MNNKITTCHLTRRAVVYVRQSSMLQFRLNAESTARQFGLKERAAALGWEEEQIEVISEDMGQSGASAEGRTGFQKLAQDVAFGRVGAVFALEVSRLARSNADWYHLLDLCGLAEVLIIDEQGVYDPRDHNDKLLLGLKGQMSEAELYWLRLRLQGGALNKARRGEMRICPPSGYLWDDRTEHFILDPDEAVQSAIRLLFERFRVSSSAGATTRWLREHGVEMPARHIDGRLTFGRPNYQSVLRILRCPIYAGTYVYGRSRQGPKLVQGVLKPHYITTVAMEDWRVVIHGAHPAYIDWEEYMRNRQRLRDHSSKGRREGSNGAPREGASLLQGLVLCGRCGHRMRVMYIGEGAWPYYTCGATPMNTHDKRYCFSLAARRIDEAVAALFLEVVRPPGIELALAVSRQVEVQADRLAQHWKLRLEQARYQARLAERRYRAVDPDNRIVARTLEREWNEKLRELQGLEEEQQREMARERLVLTAQDRAQLVSLARDLEAVWSAPTTTLADRKNLMRTLVEQVSLLPEDLPTRQIRIKILWKTGHVSELLVPRSGRGQHCAVGQEALRLIRELYGAGHNNVEIAAALNARGLRTGGPREWTGKTVSRIRNRHGFTRPRPADKGLSPDHLDDGRHSTQSMARLLGITPRRVLAWKKAGRLVGVMGPANSFWFDLDEPTNRRALASASSMGEQDS